MEQADFETDSGGMLACIVAVRLGKFAVQIRGPNP